jgi:diguanylate cyclase (GGDEF)-like protein
MAQDHVTGLASRGDFEAWLSGRESLADLAFLIVDVVGLKRVNEDRGFLAGDELLRAAARRLAAAATPAVLVARLGGDELVAVFPRAEEAADALCTIAAAGVEPRLRAGITAGTTADTRETLIDRLYATVRRS